MPLWGLSLPQGNQLRKMLLQNYLQNRKFNSRGDLPDPISTGQYFPPPCLWMARLPRPWALPPAPPPPQASPPTSGLDQDWSAIAATQCRLDKEGATKLVCDLITSTKNEKIFQESIGLAIRLLDGGNTEIQVCRAGGSPPLVLCLLHRRGTGCQVAEAMGDRPPVSSGHFPLRTHTPIYSSQAPAHRTTVRPSIVSTVLTSQPGLRPPSLFHVLLNLCCPTRGLSAPKQPLWLLCPSSFSHCFGKSASCAFGVAGSVLGTD